MKPFEQQTYYEILEIPVTAPEGDIRVAYERMLETYSPDSVAVYALVEPGQLDALRARLTEAMEILTEPELRAEYDRMIGVSQAGANTVVAPAPSRVETALAVQLQQAAEAAAPEPPKPEQEAPAAMPPAETAPAPSAAPEAPVPATAAAPAAAPEGSAAVVPVSPEQLVLPGKLAPAQVVMPSQIQAAFGSYAISYVPVLVPAPAEPSRSAEPAPASAPQEHPASGAALVHHEEDELSGVRAPLPSRAGAQPAHVPTPPSGRPSRPTTTPPPLPPGGRRSPHATPMARPGSPSGEAGRGSGRPVPAGGMNRGEAQQLAQESAIATAEAALAQVAAKAREPRPKPVELPPNSEFNGELLRRVRESRGLSLQQLADRTRISSKHLENVEADRYAALPATVYLRGILMNMARELGLDPLWVSRSYLALAAGSKEK